ncbi:MAG TPA: hypothetical protein VHT73_11630 [Thermodesulfobacteriota bacterium]|nr:hypothetical protein [Thermodesulfobacteriota bacterium]
MKPFKLNLISATLICGLIISCGPSIREVSRLPEGKSVEVNRIAVVPFFYELDYPEEAAQAAQVTPEKGMTPEVPSEIGRLIAQDLYEEMVSKIKKANTLYFETSAEEFNKVVNKSPGIMYKDAALEVARNMDTDAVLIGNVFEYREREGGELGVSSPASVAFGAQLLDTRTGQIIWEAYYAETQRPLLWNVFELDKFVKRGGKWVTANQLAREGVVKIADRLNRFLEQN